MSSNKRLKIGIVGFITGENAFGVTIPYMQYFSNIGDVEIISHTEENIRTHLDLLVIPGGPDVDTKKYLKPGEKIHLMTGKPCIIRERFDDVLLPQYVENGTPILGICRGHQALAVYFGGTLRQHMYHETNPKDSREKLVHEVDVNNNLLKQFTGGVGLVTEKGHETTIMKVNSIHHQVVKDIPKNAVEIAKYKVTRQSYSGNNTNEALIYTDRKIASVQWHPEEIYDDLTRILIFNYLLAK